MAEKQVIFHSRLREYRMPVGPVPDTQEVSCKLLLSRRLGIAKAEIAVLCDATGNTMYYPLRWTGLEGRYDRYEGAIPAQPVGLYWYHFKLEGIEGVLYAGKSGREAVLTQNPDFWQLSVYSSTYETPAWIKGGTYYHVFVDRFFRNGETPTREDIHWHETWGEQPDYLPDAKGEILNCDFFGGNLKGVAAKLRYLSSLGVTCIYLSPVFKAYSNHKYDTGDYMQIDEMFGTEQDFRDLCEKAKKNGMRVILDGVFNHTGSDSIYFNKKGTYDSLGAYQSKESPYYDWYRFVEYPDDYQSWWGIHTLPQVEENNPEFQEFITGKDGVVRKWLRAGASGWRLDVVDELPDAFVEKIKAAATAEKQDALIIGEVWEDASNKIAYDSRRHYFEGKQLDSVMNYPLRDGLLRFIVHKDAAYLAETVETLCENYPPQALACLMNALGTHDTPRTMTMLAGVELPPDRIRQAGFVLSDAQYAKSEALLKLASLLQMFLPGVPCIYYGDEAGLQGCKDPFNRGCYPWGQENPRLLAWYRKLGKLRAKLAVLKEGAYRTVLAEDGCFVFERSDKNGRLLVGVNLSDKPVTLPLDRYYENLLTGRPKKEFTLKPGAGGLYFNKASQQPLGGLYL